MNKSDVDASLRLYSDLMEEIKVRLSGIETARGSARALLSDSILVEFCLLQLRMICETIALACLVAHGRISPGTDQKSLLKIWHAEKLMEELTRIHANFFPYAGAIEVIGPHPGRVHISHKRDGFLTKDALLRLYSTCGDLLHRGSVKQLLKGAKRNVEGSSIDRWRIQIEELLAVHHIAASDNLTHWLCILRHKESGGRTTTFHAEAPRGAASTAPVSGQLP